MAQPPVVPAPAHPEAREVNYVVVTLLGCLCGLVGGCVGVFVRWSVTALKGSVEAIHDAGLLWLVFLMPLFGTAVGSGLSNRFSPAIKGSGIPNLYMAVKMENAHVPARVPLLKLVSTPLHVGLGAIGGVEGPIAQVGGSFSALLGHKVRLDRRGKTLLIACGMTGGVSSTFNAPIGGTFFGVEILYNMSQLMVNTLAPIILASVLATTVSWLVFGYQPVISAPQFTFEGFTHMPVYVFFGVLVGLYGVAWLLFFSRTSGAFEKMKISPYAKPVIAAAFSGVVLLVCVDVIDTGHGTLEGILRGDYDITALLLIFVLISVGTALSVGSGGTAGLFTPSLLIGATFGAIFGLTWNLVFPGYFDDPMKLALVGLAAFFGGMARTPLTNALMVFEMTSNYDLILPLMTVVVTSYLVNWSLLHDKSLYTINILKQLALPTRQWKQFVGSLDSKLAEIPVQRVMTPTSALLVLSPDMTKMQILEIVKNRMYNTYPVLRADKLVGVVSSHAVIKAAGETLGSFQLLDHLDPHHGDAPTRGLDTKGHYHHE